MKWKRLIYLFGVVLLLSSCSKPIEFSVQLKSTEIELGITNGCEIIKMVNDFAIQPEDIFGYHIRLPDKTQVDCSEIKQETGKQVITYKYLDKQKQFTITVIDAVKPVIQTKDDKNIFEVEVNNEFFDLKQLFSVQDNYSNEKEISVTTEGNYDLKKPGNYSIKIRAIDASGNQDEKVIELVVKPKEVVEIIKEVEKTVTQTIHSTTVEVVNTENNSNGGGNQSSAPPVQPTPQPAPAPTVSAAPQEKEFLFETHGDFQTTLQVCSNWVSSNKASNQSGSCYPIYNANDIAIGYLGKIY